MDISLFCSAIRPKWWERLVQSLEGNKCSYEVIMVGPIHPKKIIKNLTYIHCSYKPGQCYAVGSMFCSGELIGYMADDAVYDSTSLDKIWECYKRFKGHGFGEQTIFTQRTIENGKDVTDEHYFFRHDSKTPPMAPMAFMNREWFWKLGGLDRNFICGQYENDLIMRAYQDGGRIEYVSESKVYLNHEEVHGGIINKLRYKFGTNSFRSGYWSDRRYLEECWVLPSGKISKQRLLPLHPFNNENILTVPQGNQGRWSI